jgi:hypothetical protein
MPLPFDDIFGVIYLDPDSFIARAKSFGVDAAGLSADDVKPTLALASRAVEAHMGGRTFTPDAVEEMHRWDGRTRRITVNQPPVMELESFEIIFSPGSPPSSFSFAPTDVLVNNQENYLEVASLALSTGLVMTSLASVSEPQVVVRYKSYQTVLPAVAAAVGWAAAKFIQQAEAAAMLPAGLTRSKVGSEDLSRKDDDFDLPLMAKMLLRPLRAIAIG